MVIVLSICVCHTVQWNEDVSGCDVMCDVTQTFRVLVVTSECLAIG